jgi:hypothetical protein
LADAKAMMLKKAAAVVAAVVAGLYLAGGF